MALGRSAFLAFVIALSQISLSKAAVVDTSGPLIFSATVLEEATVTNKIEIVFDESLLPGTVHSLISPAVLTNDTFRVVMFGSNVVVGISNSMYSASKVTLTLNKTNWFARSNYYIIVNNV